MYRRIRISLLLFILICFNLLNACGYEEITVEGFGFERFGITMPENGTVIYDSFFNMGFDFRDYGVIAYDSNEELSKLSWSEADSWDIAQFNAQIDRHNLSLQANGEDKIPAEYLPDDTGLMKMYLDRVGKEISTMKCYLLFDSDRSLVYVYIIKT